MPHKHRKDSKHADPAYWELPPGKYSEASPLPTTRDLKSSSTAKGNAKPWRKKPTADDDTPRAFARLLQSYRPPRSGLDNGERLSKKRKTTSTTVPAQSATVMPPTKAPNPSDLKIQPHEQLSHFSARVDAAIPFATLSKTKSSNDPALKGIGKARQTKTEKRMQKMQQAWREEDKRRKEEILEQGEDLEGAVDEDGVEEMGDEEEAAHVKGKRKGKRRKIVEDEDPWKELEAKKREKGRRKESEGDMGLVGVHDVVQAPPKLHGTLKHKVNVVGREGGLKKQIELSEARQSVIEGYRAMMRQKRESNVTA